MTNQNPSFDTIASDTEEIQRRNPAPPPQPPEDPAQMQLQHINLGGTASLAAQIRTKTLDEARNQGYDYTTAGKMADAAAKPFVGVIKSDPDIQNDIANFDPAAAIRQYIGGPPADQVYSALVAAGVDSKAASQAVHGTSGLFPPGMSLALQLQTLQDLSYDSDAFKAEVQKLNTETLQATFTPAYKAMVASLEPRPDRATGRVDPVAAQMYNDAVDNLNSKLADGEAFTDYQKYHNDSVQASNIPGNNAADFTPISVQKYLANSARDLVLSRFAPQMKSDVLARTMANQAQSTADSLLQVATQLQQQKNQVKAELAKWNAKLDTRQQSGGMTPEQRDLYVGAQEEIGPMQADQIAEDYIHSDQSLPPAEFANQRVNQALSHTFAGTPYASGLNATDPNASLGGVGTAMTKEKQATTQTENLISPAIRTRIANLQKILDPNALQWTPEQKARAAQEITALQQNEQNIKTAFAASGASAPAEQFVGDYVTKGPPVPGNPPPPSTPGQPGTTPAPTTQKSVLDEKGVADINPQVQTIHKGLMANFSKAGIDLAHTGGTGMGQGEQDVRGFEDASKTFWQRFHPSQPYNPLQAATEHASRLNQFYRPENSSYNAEAAKAGELQPKDAQGRIVSPPVSAPPTEPPISTDGGMVKPKPLPTPETVATP